MINDPLKHHLEYCCKLTQLSILFFKKAQINKYCTTTCATNWAEDNTSTWSILSTCKHIMMQGLYQLVFLLRIQQFKMTKTLLFRVPAATGKLETRAVPFAKNDAYRRYGRRRRICDTESSMLIYVNARTGWDAKHAFYHVGIEGKFVAIVLPLVSSSQSYAWTFCEHDTTIVQQKLGLISWHPDNKKKLCGRP